MAAKHYAKPAVGGALWLAATALGGVLAILAVKWLDGMRVFRDWEVEVWTGIFIGAFCGILVDRFLRGAYSILRG